MIIKIRLLGFGLLLLTCCCDNKVERTLEHSGEHRAELEKVLSHYKDDSLRLRAAEFLITHLPGNVSYDTTHLHKYRPLLHYFDSVRSIEGMKLDTAMVRFGERWNSFTRYHNPQTDVYGKLTPDLTTISADYLINNIERAFEAHDRSLYKDSVRFDDFLKYVLPYRRNNGYAVEEWREHFLAEYGDYLTAYTSPRELADSLLERLKHYKVEWKEIGDYPYVRLDDYLLSQVSRCPARCWFNSMLLSALGIPCTIDYVPAWGNRNSSHEWNALVIDGKTYPFEATGGRGMWHAGKVYNNEWVDKYWMKSRLPKVFRYSYATVLQGPTTDRESNTSNTPARFLNVKYEDVSDAYFPTSDIRIPIRQGTQPKNARFAYLCVFNEDVWKPVFWGELDGGEAYFRKMGRDVVYLPVFYDNGRLIPLNDPFLLQSDGSIRYLSSETQKTETVLLERKYYARPDIAFWSEWNKGAHFEVSASADFRQGKRVFTVPECRSHPNVWELEKPVRTRYIRYVYPEHTNALAELAFYGKQGNDGQRVEWTGKPLAADSERMKTLRNVFDGDILTYADLTPYEDGSGKEWVGMDFGKEVEITAIGVCPRNDKNDVIDGMEYELFHWDGRWQSLGRQMAQGYSLTYSHVPVGALLLLKCTTEGKENRIFTYENGSQVWW